MLGNSFSKVDKRANERGLLINFSIQNASVLLTFIYLGVTSQRFLSVYFMFGLPSCHRAGLFAKEKSSILWDIFN